MPDCWGSCHRCGAIRYLQHNETRKSCASCSNLKTDGHEHMVERCEGLDHAAVVAMQQRIRERLKP
jgi:hypothetical protein